MSFSLDGISSIVDTTVNTAAGNKSTSLQGTLNGVSSESTEEELLQVCKDFTSYFVEEVLKEVKENLTDEEEESDSSLSMLKDYHMESAIEMISDEMVDQMGTGFIQQLYEQMKRNYNIE